MNNNEFCLEINLTKTCNFRCTYCYEQDNEQACFTDDKPEFEFDELIDFVNRFKNSDYIQQNHDGRIKITFWGGEPLLRFELIKKIVKYYIDDEKVNYYLYTNGYFVDELIELIGLTPKLSYQISYDGYKVHQRNRKFPDCVTDTVDIVLENIKKVSKFTGKIVPLKPTIPMGEEFRYLIDAYKDYLKLYYWYKDELKFDVSNFGFKPSPAWSHRPSSADEELEHKEIYQETLDEVARLDKLFYTVNQRHLFSWFNASLSICGAGKGLAILDRDYKMYTCHNFLYYDHDDIRDHILYDKEKDGDDLKNLFKNLSMFQNCSLCSNNRPTKKCQECEVIHCMRCNTAIYMSNDNPDFLKRWTDMGSQNTICELFKINHKSYTKYF